MPQIEPLRSFQAEDVPFFLKHYRSFMLYEPRLGKTVVTCNVLAQDPETKNVLIACSKNAFLTWIEHIPLWFKHLAPQKRVEIRIVRGKQGKARLQREFQYSRPTTADITIWLVTFEALLIDEPYLVANLKSLPVWDTIIGDEVHRKLRGHKTKTHKQFKRLVARAHRFHALSGTLAGKWGPADFWGLLHICRPHYFSSYWQWANSFCLFIDNGWGREIVGTKNMEQFHRTMQEWARIRLRKDVAPQMPTVHRELIHVDMTEEQSRIYEELGGKSYSFLPNGQILVAANSLEKETRKRQLLICPRILDPRLGYGAAIIDLVDKMEEARDEGDLFGYHIAIFSASRAALPHFRDYLRSRGFSDVDLLVGGTEPEEVARITAKFQRTQGVILCTTAFAQAFSLVPAIQCFHIGYDYDPNNNKQAEDRLVPQVGTNPINSWYYSYRNTNDDLLAHRINIKGDIITFTYHDPRPKERDAPPNPRFDVDVDVDVGPGDFDEDSIPY